MKPLTFLLPAIFLFLLGLGNISVGTFKAKEYSEVLNQLAELKPTEGLQNASPLKRLKHNREIVNRNYLRLKKARARINFYKTVQAGGVFFLCISAMLAILSMMLGFKTKNSQA